MTGPGDPIEAAQLNLEAGRPELARKALEAGLARSPRDARINRNLGVVLVKLKDATGARRTRATVYVKANGEFTIPDIGPGTYAVQFMTGSDWYGSRRTFRTILRPDELGSTRGSRSRNRRVATRASWRRLTSPCLAAGKARSRIRSCWRMSVSEGIVRCPMKLRA